MGSGVILAHGGAGRADLLPTVQSAALRARVPGAVVELPKLPQRLSRAAHRRRRGRRLAVAGLVLGCLGLALAALFVASIPAHLRGMEMAHRVRCAANLRQIGMAIVAYANENRGALPPRLEEVLLTQDVT